MPDRPHAAPALLPDQAEGPEALIPVTMPKQQQPNGTLGKKAARGIGHVTDAPQRAGVRSRWRRKGDRLPALC
jgi:hypothetical protein